MESYRLIDANVRHLRAGTVINTYLNLSMLPCSRRWGKVAFTAIPLQALHARLFFMYAFWLVAWYVMIVSRPTFVRIPYCYEIQYLLKKIKIDTSIQFICSICLHYYWIP